jgi:hypothetical protein
MVPCVMAVCMGKSIKQAWHPGAPLGDAVPSIANRDCRATACMVHWVQCILYGAVTADLLGCTQQAQPALKSRNPPPQAFASLPTAVCSRSHVQSTA